MPPSGPIPIPTLVTSADGSFCSKLWNNEGWWPQMALEQPCSPLLLSLRNPAESLFCGEKASVLSGFMILKGFWDLEEVTVSTVGISG